MIEIPDFFPKSKKHGALARYPGGKGINCHRISKLIPEGKKYFEPYCGMASVFGMMTNFDFVALNDIDGTVINIFKVLQNREKCDELLRKLIFTPYSQDEFSLAIDISKNKNSTDIDRAWAFFVAQNQGFAGIAKTYGNWGRVLDICAEYKPKAWQSKISNILWWHEKLMNVLLDNRDALDFISYWDSEDSVFYLDPPYLQSTRVSSKIYSNETNNAHHEKLVQLLLKIRGKAVLSCYDDDIYTPLFNNGWEKINFQTSSMMGSKARNTKSHNSNVPKRIETLYIKRNE